MPIDPLPVSFNEIGSDAMRTKINEIIAQGVGGAVSFGTTPPASPSDGDLWFDESTGAMYAYSSVLSGWIQTNAAGAGAGAGADCVGGFIDRISVSSSQSGAGSGSYGDGTFPDYNDDTQIIVAVNDNFILPNVAANHTGGNILGSNDKVRYYHIPDASDSTKGSGTLRVIDFISGTGSGTVHFARFSKACSTSGGGGGSGGSGGSGGGAQEMNDLSDVQTAGSGHEPADGNVLVWNSAMSHWMPGHSGGGGSGSYSTGWTQNIGGTQVANGATLTITHNLGTTDVSVDAYVNSSASDSGATILSVQESNSGAYVTNLTDNTVTLQIGSAGYVNVTATGVGYITNIAGQWVKVVVMAGSPRAFVSFNGTSSNINSSIFTSRNVSSITDNGVGDYTVNWSKSIQTPVVLCQVGEDVSAPTNLANQNINVYDADSTSVRVRINQDSAGYSVSARDKGYVGVVAH